MPEPQPTPTPTPSPTPAPTPAPTPTPTVGGGNVDLSAVAAGLLQKASGNPVKVISRLLKENHEGREKVRDLSSKLPPDGAVVLSGDDAKRWETYRSLGDDPAKIKEALDSGAQAIEWKSNHERDQSYSAAAKAGGYNEPLFKRLAAQDGIKVVTKEEANAAGKKVARPYVVNDKGKETALADYVAANWGELADALGGGAGARRAGMPPRSDDNTPPPRAGSDGERPAMTDYMSDLSRYRSL